MTGNRDRTGRDGPDGATVAGEDWAAATMARTRALVDKAVTAAEAIEIKPGDILEAGRVARTADNIARAVRSIQAAQPRVRGRRSSHPTPEKQRGEAIEYEPERVAAMRDELWSRSVELQDIIARKKRAGGAGGSGTGGSAEGAAEAGGPSVSA